MKVFSVNKIVILFAVLIIFGIRYYHYLTGKNIIPDGTKIRISSRVSSEPVQYSDSRYLKLSGYKIYLPLYPKINYGDRIVVEGISEGDKLKKPRLVEIETSKGFLYKFRESLISFYERNLPNDHSALVSGIVIGSKRNIGEQLWETLRKSGTSHVVVASGMNVTLIANFLLETLVLFVSRRRALPLVFVSIWMYAAISGFDAPIVRATVMVSAAFMAVETGRIYRSLRSLVITAVILLFIKPAWLTDLGFWLSACATASMIIFTPKFGKIFSFLPKIIKENWVTTISAQIGVVPLLYYYFGQFNILSPFANVAVLWTIVPITIIGMLAGIIGTLIDPIGKLILYLCYPLTSWFLWVVSLFN